MSTIEPRTGAGLFRRNKPIMHEEAREAATRLIHSHFGLKPHARMSIPVEASDDDVLILDYIRQQEWQDIQARSEPAIQEATLVGQTT